MHSLRCIFSALSIVSLLASPALAAAKPVHRIAVTKAPAAESAQCTKLRTDYDEASKTLALSKAEDLADDSAVRSNMRKTEDSNTIAQARITFDIMKSSGCKMPDFAPSADRYNLNMLDCVVALKKQQTEIVFARLDERMPKDVDQSACDTSKWAAK
jgi:hypothetical protein